VLLGVSFARCMFPSILLAMCVLCYAIIGSMHSWYGIMNIICLFVPSRFFFRDRGRRAILAPDVLQPNIVSGKQSV
jgi:hypothetical protein